MYYNELEENICDTIKEWQTKLGYREETMQLYYQAETIAVLLGEEPAIHSRDLLRKLQGFSACVQERLGNCGISYEGHRFCIEVPPTGVRYVAEHVRDSQFLKDFLRVVADASCGLENIRRIFASYCEDYVEEDREAEGLGRVFYFPDEKIDKYIYCVEFDEFGTEYHRFTRKDYELLKEK